MADVVVVSRNPAMAMALSGTDYDVIDLRPQEFGPWIDGTDDSDALVLDLESPQLAHAAVANLRSHDKRCAVLLVSSHRPGWDELDLSYGSLVTVLPLPVSRPALLTALAQVVDGRATSPAAAPDEVAHEEAAPLGDPVIEASEFVDAPETHVGVELQERGLDPTDVAPGDFLPPDEPQPEPAHFRTAEVLGELTDDEVSDETDLGFDFDLPERFLVKGTDADLTPALLSAEVPPEAIGDPEEVMGAATVVMAEPAAVPEPAPVAVMDVRQPEPADHIDERPALALTAVPRTRRSRALPTRTATSAVLDDLDRLRITSNRASAPPAPSQTVPPPTTASPRRGEGTEPAEVVRALAAVADLLYGVPETAEVVISDAVDRVSAGAGALMVPDDGAWRVSAGVGLRALEHRYELIPDSWLVKEVAQRNRGVIVEDSDIARERLQGAPLASWRHLLVAPVPQVHALLILARREDPPFDEDDLAALAKVGDEAGPLLQAAMDTRALARRLAEFRDSWEPPTQR